MEILTGAAEYRIRYSAKNCHRIGQGGQTTWTTCLEKKSDPVENVLESVRVVKYSTYADDSEDHATTEWAKVFLLCEDIVGRSVFEALKRP